MIVKLKLKKYTRKAISKWMNRLADSKLVLFIDLIRKVMILWHG